MRRNGVRITLKADIPEGCDATDVAEFCVDALESWGGQRHPDDPLFDSLNIEHVIISGTTFSNARYKKK